MSEPEQSGESDRADIPRIGVLPRGAQDAITDVQGVAVGHFTLARDRLQTGVTVVRPHAGDLYRDKVPAAVTVLNGFGKSVGLVQIQELGLLETPIAMTNTFGVGTVANAQIRQAISGNPEIGRSLPTVNPLVFECNDGYLNDIQAMAVQEEHYHAAWRACAAGFEQGSVGAGRGMSSFGMKGGIGSASRMVSPSRGLTCTVGVLVLSNFGRGPNLVVAGRPFGRHLYPAAPKSELGAQSESQSESGFEREFDSESGPERGSIIIVVATDAGLDARQLRRLSLRAGVGLARTGSVFGHGSGDIALAFSTAYTVPHEAGATRSMPALLHDTLMDPLFEAVAEATEQAILSALWHATTVRGRDDHERLALTQRVPHWRDLLQGTIAFPS
jgi:D-aminopeptidase